MGRRTERGSGTAWCSGLTVQCDFSRRCRVSTLVAALRVFPPLHPETHHCLAA